MNAAMSRTNRFTSPIKEGTVGGVNTELYQFNTVLGSPIAYNFNLTVNGVPRAFNVVNPTFKDNGVFSERTPDTTNLFNMIYRNDSQGFNSPDTGFFVYFRQGNLDSVDFNYTAPLQNRVENIGVENIAEGDVYLQEIDSNGLVLNNWERVANVVGETLNYNSVELNNRNLYAIENRGADGIRLRFSDGNFANVPVGLYRFWHRVSDPVRYTIQPEDARNKSITIPYADRNGRRQDLTLTFSLQTTVNNSLPAEGLNSIKNNAPQVFYTQNRMVSAQDYNVFPQSQSSNITKLTAINRTHAGHSRYIDLNDPTGTYQNVDTFADDAFLYVEIDTKTDQVIVNNNTTPIEVVASFLPSLLREREINNFVYYNMYNVLRDPARNGSLSNFVFTPTDNITWNPLPARTEGKTGFLTEEFSTPGTVNVLVNNTVKTSQFKENTLVKFTNPADTGEFKWTRIISVASNGALSAGVNTSRGPFAFSEEIPGGWYVSDTIVSLRKLFTVPEATLIEQKISDKETFGLGYDLLTNTWYVIENDALDKSGPYAINGSQRGPSSWLLLLEKEDVNQFTFKYNVTQRSLDYVIQSEDDIQFYNVKNVKVVGSNNKSSQDLITFSTVNTKPSTVEVYEWDNTVWENKTTGTRHAPAGVGITLPLVTRDTGWRDISVAWQSNFGILESTGSIADNAANNNYVNETTVPLNVFVPVNESITSGTNVVIQENVGAITFLPSRIRIPFNANTFGSNIIDTSGNASISYKQTPIDGASGSEVVFLAEVGTSPVSYGVDGSTIDTSAEGKLFLIDYDVSTQTGNLEYRNIQTETLHSSTDVTGQVSSDKLVVTYFVNRSNLTESITWEIADVYTEADGFTDARKVRVAPFDTDSDLVPDRPRQFAEFVGERDLVLFEFFTDLDGFIYDRPFFGRVLDVRTEETLDISVADDSITPIGRDRVSVSSIEWIIVKNLSSLSELARVPSSAGMIGYVLETNKTYQLTPLSTSPDDVQVVESRDYFVKPGRGKTQNTTATVQTSGTIRWQHVAPNDVRIDPSISNIVEMTILTTDYFEEVQRWQADPSIEFPLEPTSNELSSQFSGLNIYKAASDTLTFRSAKFKLLFGTQSAEAEANFRVVKLSDNISDNELKTRIISTINEYFNVNNWDFGETFYFTELATYIHQQLGSSLGSIVIVPRNTSGKFGQLFQVKSDPNELFISTATVNDIEIISRLDNQTLRIDN